jgi:hypothetical protein
MFRLTERGEKITLSLMRLPFAFATARLLSTTQRHQNVEPAYDFSSPLQTG